MATGVVKWFDPEKGFGFISPDDGSTDVFVRLSQLDAEQCPALRENARVAFEVAPSPHGPQAVSITAIA
jgi:CspA family cold shock protein